MTTELRQLWTLVVDLPKADAPSVEQLEEHLGLRGLRLREVHFENLIEAPAECRGCRLGDASPEAHTCWIGGAA